MDQAPKMEEYFELSMYGRTETGEDPDAENDYYYTQERYWYHPNYFEGRGKEIYPVNKFPEEPAYRDGDMIANNHCKAYIFFTRYAQQQNIQFTDCYRAAFRSNLSGYVKAELFGNRGWSRDIVSRYTRNRVNNIMSFFP